MNEVIPRKTKEEENVKHNETQKVIPLPQSPKVQIY